MKDLIKKYEELLVVTQIPLSKDWDQSQSDAIKLNVNIYLTIIEDLKKIEKEQGSLADALEKSLDNVHSTIDDLKAPKLDSKGKVLTINQRIKTLNIAPVFQNNERMLLQRLVKDEIATPRKKYGTSKMNTLYSLEGKLKK